MCLCVYPCLLTVTAPPARYKRDVSYRTHHPLASVQNAPDLLAARLVQLCTNPRIHAEKQNWVLGSKSGLRFEFANFEMPFKAVGLEEVPGESVSRRQTRTASLTVVGVGLWAAIANEMVQEPSVRGDETKYQKPVEDSVSTKRVINFAKCSWEVSVSEVSGWANESAVSFLPDFSEISLSGNHK